MFGLTGFPPLGGFIGKYLVFAAAIDSGLTWLAILGVLMSVVSAVYYLRVLVVVWMRSPDEAPEPARSARYPVATATAVVVGLSVAALLALGVIPGTLIEITESVYRVAAPVVLLP